MQSGHGMKLFMEPRSAAVIGVSRHTGPGSFNILENLVKSGFAGQLYAVNPYVDDIMGSCPKARRNSGKSRSLSGYMAPKRRH